MEVFGLDHLNSLIVSRLHDIRKLDFDVVVHLPRSGTIPASLIATHIAKPLASVDEFCAGMIIVRKVESTQTLHRILLVDDSVNRGIQMNNAITKIKQKRPEAEIKTLCIYSNQGGLPDRVYHPDLTLHSHGPGDYFFPWFLWKTKWIDRCALDMDGVLCRDCRPEENDDGENYKGFLRRADLKFRSLHKAGAIVTGRLEKYRAETEDWLDRHGIRYDRLIMGPWSSIEERKRYNPARWKAEIYKSLPQNLFVESSDKEAKIIAELSGKRVWCIDTQRFL